MFSRECRNGNWDPPSALFNSNNDDDEEDDDDDKLVGTGAAHAADAFSLAAPSIDVALAGGSLPIITPRGVNVHHIALSYSSNSNSSGQIGGGRALFSAENDRVIRRHIPAQSRFSSRGGMPSSSFSEGADAGDVGRGAKPKPTSWAPLWAVLELPPSASSSLLALDFLNKHTDNNNPNFVAPGLLLMLYELNSNNGRRHGHRHSAGSSGGSDSHSAYPSSSSSHSYYSSDFGGSKKGSKDDALTKRDVVIELAFAETGTICAQGRVQLMDGEVLKSGTWHIGDSGMPEALLLVERYRGQQRQDRRSRHTQAVEVRLKTADLAALHFQCRRELRLDADADTEREADADTAAVEDGATKSIVRPMLMPAMHKEQQRLRG